MSKYMSAQFSGLKAYTPGEQPLDMEYVKLNTNESPFPPSPQVIKVIQSEQAKRLNLYPDPEYTALRQALAQRYGVNKDNVFVANGSDEVLNFSFLAFCDANNGIAFPNISYGFYQVFAQLYHIPAKIIPLRPDFHLAPEDYWNLDCNIVFANPNAPTGLAISAAQVESIVQRNPKHVVVVDEAYVDFGGESCVPLTKQYDNLLVCMTFSKSRSMAGARLGFAIANEALIEDLDRIRYSTNPYNINRLTAKAGVAAVESEEYYKENCRVIRENRAYTETQLERRGFYTLPSQANFLFTRCPDMDGSTLYQALKRRGVLVRYWDKPILRNYVRVTIGSRSQMDVFLAAVDDARKEK
ncbi:histidinol-phosphate transaminase [uncultured Ruthenibacterium sp.]|uniref:histidinol-phosphate transaminase n=1 Tax=uncultured Ruthenibacterium sp. TaxID=1905347 RepID=UPI00349EB4BF